jgi:hypothetical protein
MQLLQSAPIKNNIMANNVHHLSLKQTLRYFRTGVVRKTKYFPAGIVDSWHHTTHT